jgi:hypothetical protein
MLRILAVTSVALLACDGAVASYPTPVVVNQPRQPAMSTPVSEAADASVVSPMTPDEPPANDTGTATQDAGQVTPGKSDAGPVKPACTASMLCEDFESVAVGSAPKSPWVIRQRQGQVKVDESKAANGTRSLKLTTDGYSSGETYREAMIRLEGAPHFPLAQKNLFGRMRVFLPSIPAGPDVHYDFASATGPMQNTTTSVFYGGMVNKKWLAVYGRWDNGDDCSRSAPTASVPENRWFCMEFQFDSAKSEQRLWVDGVELKEVFISKTGDACVGRENRDWQFPNTNLIDLGWRNWQPYQPGQTMWIDDVALSTTRIGCD